MQTLHVIKLNVPVRDRASGEVGVLTHLHVEMDTSQRYLFKPTGLNPEDGQPLKGQWVVPDRIAPVDIDHQFISTTMELPLEVLGTTVRHANSGFTGMAIALFIHINGCVHVEVQPQGRIAKTNALIGAVDFDLRSIEGEAVPSLTPEKLAESRTETPSPEPMEARRCPL